MAEKKTEVMLKKLFGEISDEELQARLQSNKGIVISEGNVQANSTKLQEVCQGKGKGIMNQEHKGNRSFKGSKNFAYVSCSTSEVDKDFDNPSSYKQDYVAQNENEENLNSKEKKSADKKVGPPMLIEVPPHRQLTTPDKCLQMRLFKLSNIVYFDPRPFDPATYVEDEIDLEAELHPKKQINVVRWRIIKNPDGTTSRETNSRFVRWADGSLQLLIGNETLDVTETEAEHLQAHVHQHLGMGLFVTKGQPKFKMSLTPTSLSTRSHRSLSALVDSQFKKVPKVKSYHAKVDPEWEMDALKKRKKKKVKQKLEKDKVKNKKHGGSNSQLSAEYLEDGGIEVGPGKK